jgi:PqqD family protein of HPr-rel-A system
MDDQSWTWPEKALSWRIWDEDVVVYNDLSGHTHKLTRQQFRLLRAFEAGPCTLHDVLASFPDSDLMEAVENADDLVLTFEGLGLLLRQDS